jgi:ribosomal protein L12E/L44/L45/RPP1/RPP2
MAELERMTAEEVVRHLLEDEAGADLVRDSLRWLVQQLMEAEVSELIGAAHGSAQRTAPPGAMATGRAGGTRALASSSCASRSCARAATSPRFWSRAGEASRRCWR